MNFIKDLHDGDEVDAVYLCKLKKKCQKPEGNKSYYSLVLQDNSGVIDARIFNLAKVNNDYKELDYVKVKGKIVSFQNALQMHIHCLRKCEEGEYDPKDYVPASQKSVEFLYSELLEYVKSIQNPGLHQLVESFFIKDVEFKKVFCTHSAAKNVHHSFQGGLLEHTVGVVKTCSFIAESFPIINRDLLLVAAMFHDIGKTKELSPLPENDYTDEGQLLGHIMIGIEMINAKVKLIEGLSTKLINELKHCIISHHGSLEYGSPKVPATIEALALSLADNMDARLQTMSETIMKADSGLEWLGYNRYFDSNIRRSSK